MAKENFLKKYSVKAWLRFVIWSVIGVVAFFINVPCPFPEHIQIGGWVWGTISQNANVFVSHLTNLIKACLLYTSPSPRD